MKNSSFRKRVGFAINGVRTCWRSEANFRIQLAIGLLAIAALIVLRPAPLWWALVGLVITLVLAFELMNSALERLIDHLHPAIHPEIGFVKDMAAGAVLMISIGSVIVGGALVVSTL